MSIDDFKSAMGEEFASRVEKVESFEYLGDKCIKITLRTQQPKINHEYLFHDTNVVILGTGSNDDVHFIKVNYLKFVLNKFPELKDEIFEVATREKDHAEFMFEFYKDELKSAEYQCDIDFNKRALRQYKRVIDDYLAILALETGVSV